VKNALARFGIPLALLVACLGLVTYPAVAQEGPAAAPAPPPPLVIIDGVPVTAAAFDTYIDQTHGSELMLKMVAARLIWQEAKRQGLKLSTEALEQAIVADKSDHGTEADFRAALHEKGLDWATYRKRKQLDIALTELREREASVPDEDMQAYYDEHKEELAVVPRAHVHQIVLDDVAAAYAAAEKAKASDDFAAVARELSTDEESREKGGDLGWVAADDVASDALRSRIFSIELNQVSAPIEADGKFCIVKVDERVAGGVPPFDAVKEQIQHELLPEYVRSEDGYVRMLLRQANIAVSAQRYAWLKDVIEDAKHVQIYVAGERIRARPLRLQNGGLLVPAREVLTALQADTKWDPDTRTYTATRGEGSLELTVDEASARVNGRIGAIPWPPRMVEGKLYVPPRLVMDAFGGSVKYNTPEYRLDLKLEPDEDE
jgi:foldase protein PrsA